MKVLAWGGTGSIGGAIVDVLQQRGHEVLAIGRSTEACETLRRVGAIPVKGDLRDPAEWVDVALFWSAESLLHRFIFDYNEFILWSTDSNALWMRLLVVTIIILFGVFIKRYRL